MVTFLLKHIFQVGLHILVQDLIVSTVCILPSVEVVAATLFYTHPASLGNQTYRKL